MTPADGLEQEAGRADEVGSRRSVPWLAVTDTSAPQRPLMTDDDIALRIASDLQVRPGQVKAAIELIDGGSTVPFIARYRKEVTGSLDDAQLRALDEALRYFRELLVRKKAVLGAIEEQGKLTDELRRQIVTADNKARLEDVYLPYKKRRRTKADIAREAGLQPLADRLLADPELDPHTEAAGFVTESVADAGAALEGARAILIERFAQDADLVGELRETLWTRGRLAATVRDEKKDSPAAQKYRDYFEFSDPLTDIPSHRALALFRGEAEDVLRVEIVADPDADPATPTAVSDYERRIAARHGVADRGRPADRWLGQVVRWAWRTKILVSLGIDVRSRVRDAAEEAAVGVFAQNLTDLLLAAPAGGRPTMGLDPGLRTGVKVAVVDGTGKVVDTATIYPHEPHRKVEQSLTTLAALAEKHRVELIAIGNGTASRETDVLAGKLIERLGAARSAKGDSTGSVGKVVVSEAGASVYSASEYASRELPGLDVSLRGAVSIARRLQDPLAELVKIDPKSIGVGQYQHDITPQRLARSLEAVVEDAVNAVGVDLNVASAPLLARVSGVTSSLAAEIVAHRDRVGAFASRRQLLDVARLGPKAFEQCAGFLRIRGGDDPLDASAVHPEAYPVVRSIQTRTGIALAELIGNSGVLGRLTPADFADERFGVPTVTDIITELDKPGRDPRPEFVAARFAEGVHKVADLVPGMVLEGVVTNVAAFGAFVDVGVHQDGLVHVSAMSRSFVSDPHDVVRSGQVVKVKVMEVDLDRQRIGLTLRLDDEPCGTTKGGAARGGAAKGGAERGAADADAKGRRGGSGREGQARSGQARSESGRGAARVQGGRGDASSRQGSGGRPGRSDGGRVESGRSTGGRRGEGRSEAQSRAGARDGRDRRDAPSGSMAEALRQAGFGR